MFDTPIDWLWITGSALAAISLVCHLRAEARGPRWQVYLFKPLTTGLIVLMATAVAVETPSRYTIAIAVGLVFSLAGDVFLMLPVDRFTLGLASFLVAHVAYLVAFTTNVAVGSAPLLLLPFALAAGVLVSFLWKHLGSKRVPVVLYAGVLAAMAWLATSRVWVLGGRGAECAAIGAVLFVVSDGSLAVNRFRARFAHAQTLIMTTYVVAQWLIALSSRLSA